MTASNREGNITSPSGYSCKDMLRLRISWINDISHKERIRLISVTGKLGDEMLEISFVGENQDGCDMSETLKLVSSSAASGGR
jgi:hypothetical protein